MAEESRNAGKVLRERETTQPIIAAGVADEHALAVEFALNGVAFIRQKAVRLFYGDHQIGEHRLDFLVEDKIIVELKAVEALENVHFAIVRSYLKATGLADGLILNFSTMPLTVERVCRERSFVKTYLHL